MSKDAPFADSHSSQQDTELQELPIRGPKAPLNTEQGERSLEVPHTKEISMESKTSVAVDPVALITTECITVTSAMRKHARWAHSSVSSILGGSSSPMNPNPQNSRPSTPRDDIGSRKGQKGSRNSSGFVDGSDDGGLANRWGLRGK